MRSLLRPRDLWRGIAIGTVAIFVVRVTYHLFLDLAEGRPGHVAERLFDEITGGALALVPLGAVAWLARRVPLAPPVGRRTLAVYAASFVVLSAAHTAAMIAARAALGPALGFDGYGWAFSAARFAYEGANDFVVFVAAVALIALAEHVLARRERERRAAELERSLLRAELASLRLQLQPHFLFNALNTISSTMYDDVAAADALLGRLAELLRASLRTTHAQEVAARDELALLDQYLALMRARFGDALDVTVDAPDDARDLLLPSMSLQPLVENAVRHGALSRVGRGRVVVALRRDGDALEIRVRDAGAASGVASGVASGGDGTGLTTTARRLRLLYGDDHTMRAGSTADGWEVAIRIPARRAPSPAEPRALAKATA